MVSQQPAMDDYAFRSEAVSALAFQKDMRAIAPLRAILSEVESWQIGDVVRALLASGGFTISEQVEALETVAKNTGDLENEHRKSTSSNILITPMRMIGVNAMSNNYVVKPPV